MGGAVRPSVHIAFDINFSALLDKALNCSHLVEIHPVVDWSETLRAGVVNRMKFRGKMFGGDALVGLGGEVQHVGAKLHFK
jgi:hypothetical protein